MSYARLTQLIEKYGKQAKVQEVMEKEEWLKNIFG